MIRYELRCDQAHEFDGWFKDSAAFDKLAAVGLVECPHCGPTKVAKRLMAPAIPKKGRPARNAKPEALPAPVVEAPAPPPSPPALPWLERVLVVGGHHCRPSPRHPRH